jgi:branched-chain amino acid transport system substrate-binding protein
MWMSRIFRFLYALSITAAPVGGASAQTTVKIRMVMPLTGTLAAAGTQVVAGAHLYVAQHGGTVAGKRIELVVKDDGSSFDVGKRLIQEVIVNHEADIIAGGLTRLHRSLPKPKCRP